MIKQFNSTGVIFPDDVVDPGLIQEIKQLSTTFKHGSKFNPHLSFPNDATNPFLRLMSSEVILKYVRELLGNDLMMWNCHLYTKSSQAPNQVEWHQDSYYFPLYPKIALTVWVALDDVDHENGGMYYLPKKLNSDLEHVSNDGVLSFKYYIDSKNIDDTDQILNARQSGQFSIHDFHTVHRSGVNQTALSRSSMIIRYSPSFVHYDHIEHQARLNKDFNKIDDRTLSRMNTVIRRSPALLNKNNTKMDNAANKISDPMLSTSSGKLNTGIVIVSGNNLNSKNII